MPTLLAELPRLRLLVTTGMRNASIDVAAAASHGVTVCGTHGVAGSTAQHTWALILALVRNIPAEVADFRGRRRLAAAACRSISSASASAWSVSAGSARASPRVGVDFEMDVVAWSPNLTDERAAAAGVDAHRDARRTAAGPPTSSRSTCRSTPGHAG